MLELRHININNITDRMTVVCKCPKCCDPSLLFYVDLQSIKTVSAECCNKVQFLSKGKALDLLTAYQVKVLDNAKGI